MARLKAPSKTGCGAEEYTEPLLKVRNLSVEYRSNHGLWHRAVDGVSFEISSGEALGIVGESGCGKTSLALALLGLHEEGATITRGSVFVSPGVDLMGLKEPEAAKFRGSRISLISQEPSLALCPVRPVGDQIADVVHAHETISWKESRARAGCWLRRLGLDPAARFFAAYPHELSGGQLQRVVLAQALICGPEILVADEPTSALDAGHQADFVALLREIRLELGLSLLLISHTPEIQASLVDRLLVMKAGRIVEEGSLEKVLRSPNEAYTRELLWSADAGA